MERQHLLIMFMPICPQLQTQGKQQPLCICWWLGFSEARSGQGRSQERMNFSLVHLCHDVASALITSSGQKWPSLGLKIKPNFWNKNCWLKPNQTVILKSTEKENIPQIGARPELLVGFPVLLRWDVQLWVGLLPLPCKDMLAVFQSSCLSYMNKVISCQSLVWAFIKMCISEKIKILSHAHL